MTRRRWGVPVVLGLGFAVAATAAGFRPTAGHGGADRTPPGRGFSAAAGEVPTPQKPAFVVHRPRLLPAHESIARFAPVRQTAVARAEPSPTAPPVAPLGVKTPEGTTNL